MKKRHISIGPGAASLILIIVVLAMTMLGAMALLNAREDARLTRRSAKTTEEVYALYERAERSLAALDAAARQGTDGLAARLPGNMTLLEDGKTVVWTEREDTRSLECEAEIRAENGGVSVTWRAQRLLSGVEDIWND